MIDRTSATAWAFGVSGVAPAAGATSAMTTTGAVRRQRRLWVGPDAHEPQTGIRFRRVSRSRREPIRRGRSRRPAFVRMVTCRRAALLTGVMAQWLVEPEHAPSADDLTEGDPDHRRSHHRPATLTRQRAVSASLSALGSDAG